MTNATQGVSTDARARHLAWLHHLTGLPTAAGRELRVIDWVRRWAGERPDLAIRADACGNLTISRASERGSGRPVYFTAHMDHPAFVVERIVAPGVIELSFRGGVMDVYFPGARVRVFDGEGGVHRGVVGEASAGAGAPFKHYEVTLDGRGGALRVGDVGVWDLPEPGVIDGMFHAPACDDLAALAAGLAAMDVLRADAGGHDVRVLLTRAEEIGFIGAIGACREGTVPREARVITLENSRSFAESPIGGGPIVRVGDRMSVFSPGLTGAVAQRAEDIAGGPASVRADQKLSEAPAWKWQRKLMAGGACEASVFCHSGYEATCVCLPLGSYHNMADLDRVQAGTNTDPPRIEREFIAVADFEGLVDLLIACGQRLPDGGGAGDRFDRLWEQRRFVLE